jgi:hypothetical protein
MKPHWRTSLTGDLPVNTGGDLVGFGPPLGALSAPQAGADGPMFPSAHKHGHPADTLE